MGALRSCTLHGSGIDGYRLLDIDAGAAGLEARFAQIEGGPRPTYRIDVELTADTPLGALHHPLLVRLEHPRVTRVLIPVAAEVLSVVEFRGNRPGSEVLVFDPATRGQERRLELVILNHDPSVPYRLREVELAARPKSEPFTWEILEDQRGVRYRVRLTVAATLTTSFHGALRLLADHPDVPEHIIPFGG